LRHLEERDQYFTKLTHWVDETVERLGKPVVFVGQGMGNKLVQYFLWMSMFPMKCADY
jgi:hypothetical protein